MPFYDYQCVKCEQIEEIKHSIHEDPKYKCSNCNSKMERQISMGSYVITTGLNGTLEDHKESEHTKKVKDPERAVRSRKKEFGHDAVGDPGMCSDPRHVVKRGRTLGGQQKDIDKGEFIKAAAKDDHMVNEAIKAVKNAPK
jgi:putative FmdB family regulatory protein